MGAGPARVTDGTVAIKELTGLRQIGGDTVKRPPRRGVTEGTLRRRFARLEQRGRAIDALRPLPGPGETLHLAMDGSYSAWALVTAMVEILAEPIERLTISTLGFNRDNADDLLALLDAGAVRAALLNVSTYFRSSDRDVFDDVKRAMVARGQRVMVTRSHAKLVLARTATRSIVVEMSANLRSSQNWEQATICDSAEVLGFHEGWIARLREEYNE